MIDLVSDIDRSRPAAARVAWAVWLELTRKQKKRDKQATRASNNTTPFMALVITVSYQIISYHIDRNIHRTVDSIV